MHAARRMSKAIRSVSPVTDPSQLNVLTDREREVLRIFAEGLTYDEIGELRNNSPFGNAVYNIQKMLGFKEEALPLAQRLRPDVILMDVLMHGTDGIDACREITTAMPDAKVLMLSAFTDRSASNRAAAAGALGYLPKLWSRYKLLDTLRDVAKGRHSPPTPGAVQPPLHGHA